MELLKQYYECHGKKTTIKKYLSVLKRKENIQGTFKELGWTQNKNLELHSISENNKTEWQSRELKEQNKLNKLKEKWHTAENFTHHII